MHCSNLSGRVDLMKYIQNCDCLLWLEGDHNAQTETDVTDSRWWSWPLSLSIRTDCVSSIRDAHMDFWVLKTLHTHHEFTEIVLASLSAFPAIWTSRNNDKWVSLRALSACLGNGTAACLYRCWCQVFVQWPQGGWGRMQAERARSHAQALTRVNAGRHQ